MPYKSRTNALAGFLGLVTLMWLFAGMLVFVGKFIANGPDWVLFLGGAWLCAKGIEFILALWTAMLKA